MKEKYNEKNFTNLCNQVAHFNNMLKRHDGVIKMLRYEILIKSGTSGYYDYDGCDMCIEEDYRTNIPISLGNKIQIQDNLYIVTDIIFCNNLVKCYVIREYEAEENKYKKLLDDLTHLIKEEDNLKSEALRTFADEWKHNNKY